MNVQFKQLLHQLAFILVRDRIVGSDIVAAVSQDDDVWSRCILCIFIYLVSQTALTALDPLMNVLKRHTAQLEQEVALSMFCDCLHLK